MLNFKLSLVLLFIILSFNKVNAGFDNDTLDCSHSGHDEVLINDQKLLNEYHSGTIIAEALIKRHPLQIDEDISTLFNDLNRDFSKLSLSLVDKTILYDYSASGFVEVNRKLRSNNSDIDCETLFKISKIEEIMKRTTSKYNITFFRGHNYLPKNSDKEGYEYVEKGFLSTSIKKEIAYNFSLKRSGPQVLDIIHIHEEGIQGLWLLPLSARKREFEYLLPRNIHFRVISVEKKWSLFGRTKITRHLIQVKSL